ncbi:zinc-dependent metalloprotease [Flagellimonas marinaquae]|uniref:M57 family metalloprotease n=1 Tax=Flagellimonas aurea TaxID=2915619 RepID=UPI001CE0BD85|nr:zinc-dependent metalloprotease [Allomuricauda aquimarina]
MKKVILCSFLTVFLLSGCNNENEIDQPTIESSVRPLITSTLLVDYEIPPNDIYYLQKLGFSGSIAKIFEKYNSSTNEKYISYLLEGDIEIRASMITDYLPEEIIDKNGGLTSQYRTTLIADPDIYTVFYEPDGSLTSQAVDMAIENYNNLNLGISFERIGTGNTYIERRRRQIGWYYLFSDIAIESIDFRNGGGGSSGYPSRQQISNRQYQNMPHQNIIIDPDTESSGLNVLEHVITHEMGHSIGLRHTDYFNRQLSGCPQFDSNGNPIPPNEGQGSYGAVHIPGTPAMNNIDLNSIMQACYGTNETGEFTNYDIIALQELW